MHRAERAAIRLLTFAAILAAACRRSEPDEPASSSAGKSAEAPATTEPPPQVPGFAFPLEPAAPTALRAVVAFPALRFALPVFVTHAPGDPGSLYVVEQDGRILRFPNRPDVTKSEVETFLDIHERVRRKHNEEGLLGLAFDPSYPETGIFYVYYSASDPRRNQLSRFVARDFTRADPQSERPILRLEKPYGNHNGGWIALGPDGYLYVTVGDGGSRGDPHGNAQDLGTLLGDVLRLRVGPGIDGYEIPPDNPFVGTPGARPEIYAYGLRNAWRCGFDRQTGALWCGDVGQDAWEEIDIVTKGGNYGWNVREGLHPYEGGGEGPFVDPVLEYGHGEGVCVTGGYVYRGTRLADFRGTYIYGDFVGGRVWALDLDGTEVRHHAKVSTVLALASFGEDAQGELFAASLDGNLYRFEPTDPSVAARRFPARLSETGLFTDAAALAPSPALVPYAVAEPQAVDGAEIRRWLFVPPGEAAAYDPAGAWRFPVGTVAVQHLELRAAPEAPPRRVETRVLIHERRGWAGYAYRWNDAQTDAELVTTPIDAVLELPGAPAGARTRWRHATGAECLRCHAPAEGHVLGLRTHQLSGTPEGRALVSSLVQRGRLSGAPAELGAPR